MVIRDIRIVPPDLPSLQTPADESVYNLYQNPKLGAKTVPLILAARFLLLLLESNKKRCFLQSGSHTAALKLKSA